MKQQLYRAGLVCVFLSFSFGGAVRSQQQSSPPAQSQQSDDKDPNAQQKPDAPPPDAPPATPLNGLGADPNALQIHQLNGATPLPTGRVSVLQLGPVYVQSVDFYEALETISASTQPTLSESVSILRSDIVFDQAWRTSRLAVQYEPRLTITNGLVQTSTSNLNAAWDTLFAVTPRLSLGLKNNFGYFGQQAQFDGLNLEADLTTGTLVQAQFLDGTGHFLNDRSEVDIRYLLSPRNRLDITPFFEYYSASGTQNLNVTESKSPGGQVGFSRLLTPNMTIGVGYSAQDTFFGNFLPTTFYQTVDLTIAQQVSPTWRYSGTIGATRATTAIQPAELTTTGNFNLIKLFRDSSMAFQYYRGQDVGLQITNGFADRFDLTYKRNLTPRTKLTLGVGYYRQFLAATDTRGIYTSAGVAYQLANRWFLETTFTFKNQQNGGANFANGNLNFASVGIRWEPGYRPAAIN